MLEMEIKVGVLSIQNIVNKSNMNEQLLLSCSSFCVFNAVINL